MKYIYIYIYIYINSKVLLETMKILLVEAIPQKFHTTYKKITVFVFICPERRYSVGNFEHA